MACQRCSNCNANYASGSHCPQCGDKLWYSTTGTPDVVAEKAKAEGKRADAIECGRCGYEVTGYTKADLVKEGWAWHADNGCEFVMCGECEEEFAQRRLERALGTTV